MNGVKGLFELFFKLFTIVEKSSWIRFTCRLSVGVLTHEMFLDRHEIDICH